MRLRTESCRTENNTGTCTGVRRCGEEGLSACDAREASYEVCDLIDNDCNGKVDDLAADKPCQIANHHGVCPGRPSCAGEEVVCQGEGAGPENCDGLDNDCDGAVDEGHPDADGDGSADCVDPDDDNDERPDEADNCQKNPNADQADLDEDGLGDACDSDLDGDGYIADSDCAPRDRATHPGAPELCNGLDDDCDGLVDEDVAACDDGLRCTVDLCDPSGGGCLHVTEPSVCADNNPCTDDACSPQVGCVNRARPGWPPCDDGDPNTVNDACWEGVCRGQGVAGVCKSFADCNDGNPCTQDICEPATGKCRHDAQALAGLACDADGDGCTVGDRCVLGVCEAGAPMRCEAADGPCWRSACRSTGAHSLECATEPAPAGTSCWDGSPCTLVDTCDGAGACRGRALSDGCCRDDADCDDGVPCTADACHPASGVCRHTPQPDGALCDADGDACTQGDMCVAGVCKVGHPVDCESAPGAAPHGQCQVRVCTSLSSTEHACAIRPAPPGSPCDDNNPCTTNDYCSLAGTCAGGGLSGACCHSNEECDDGNPCTAGTCDPANGQCKQRPLPDDTPCDGDANGCTGDDRCRAGACVPGKHVECAQPESSCMVAVCVSLGPEQVQCKETPAPAGAPCDDGDLCTGTDSCDGQGRCRGQSAGSCCRGPAECDDGNPCTFDSCRSGVCEHEAVADGESCTDGDFCTLDDVCRQGLCRGTSLTCDDGNPCTRDMCNSVMTCVHLPLLPGEEGCPRSDTEVADPVTHALISASVHNNHTCAVRSPGRVMCWGRNRQGQLGTGNTLNTRSATPVEVLNLSDALEVAAGYAHSCALTAGGRVRCWGDGSMGQLGHGSQADSAQPVLVQSITNAIAVAAGGHHTCALSDTGAVLCWGSNNKGQVGGASMSGRAIVPQAVRGLAKITQIAAGTSHSCARRADGRVLCWGAHNEGQLGYGLGQDRADPVEVPGVWEAGFGAAVQVAAGSNHSCALLSSGRVRCWGRNYEGQLGTGYDENWHNTPVEVVGIYDAVYVGAGAQHTCAVSTTGTIRCWGDNRHGQLGNGAQGEGSLSLTPVPVANLSEAVQVTAGLAHTCAIARSGTGLCWGEGREGQLGNGDVEASPVPQAVGGAL